MKISDAQTKTIPNQQVSIKLGKKIKPTRILLHIVLIFGAFLMVAPFLWTISSSLKDMSQIFLVPPKWFPDPVTFQNYPNSLTAMPFGKAYFNSFYITGLVVFLNILTCSMAAYAFAKIRFYGSNVLFILFLATMMIPKQVTMVPLYLIMDKLGWIFITTIY
jgi:multiple sugar transport system permease protein